MSTIVGCRYSVFGINSVLKLHQDLLIFLIKFLSTVKEKIHVQEFARKSALSMAVWLHFNAALNSKS